MNQERIYKVLLGPHVSEKATNVAEKNRQFVFKVAPCATKLEIKKAVEQLFNVKVSAVQVLNKQGKTRRTAHGLSRRASVKKAYVSLREGFDIDFATVQ